MGDDAKKMEAIDVILIDREDFTVVALCFGKLAGLMMAQRRGQLVGNPTRGAGGRARWRRCGDSRRLLGCSWSLFSLHGEVTRCKPTSPKMTAGRVNNSSPFGCPEARSLLRPCGEQVFLLTSAVSAQKADPRA